MNKTHVRIYISAWRRLRALALSGVLLCLVLLSACSGATSSSPTTSVENNTPTPTVDSSLQINGKAQLLTFQQWITLMQQYQGDVTTYQQQYNSDQQALRSATSDAAYKTALQALNTHIDAIQIPAMKTEMLVLVPGTATGSR